MYDLCNYGLLCIVYAQDDGGDGPLSLSVCAWGFREHEFVSVPRFSSGRRHVWWKDVAVTFAPK